MHGQVHLRPNAPGSLRSEPTLSQKGMREKQRSIAPRPVLTYVKKKTGIFVATCS